MLDRAVPSAVTRSAIAEALAASALVVVAPA